MTRQSKCVVVAVIITLLLTAFMFSCFATSEPSVTTEPPVATDAPTPPQDNTSEPTVDPSTDVSTEPTTDPSDVVTEDPSDTPTQEPTDNNHYDDFDNYGDNDNDGIPDNTDNNVDDVTSNTPQFPTSEINREETKWQEITLEKSNKSSAKSFKTIKENKSTDDNGQWILIAGLIMIALAIIGIIYFIIAMITYSKKKKKYRTVYKEPRNNHHTVSEDITVIADTHFKENTVKPATPHRERTAIADKKLSEEFLSAADYNKKIRHSGSQNGPKHFK